MPSSIRYILTIAANERTMLYRTPKFWVLAAIGGFFTTMALLGTTIAAIVEGNPEGEFLLEGTDAWIALYFFSYVQTIIIIFVAGDFRKAEQQVYLDQVMLSRPMTTANWVIGKYLGVVSAMVVLNTVFLVLSAIGRVFKMIFLGVGMNLLPAVQYFCIATLPSILFMTALVFFLISLLRVQALAIVIPIGYISLILFQVQHRYEGLLDYGCFFAPLFHSDLVGFGDIRMLLWQRIFYVLLAFALLCGTIILYPRLRQSIRSQRITQAGTVLFLAGAITVGVSIWRDHTSAIQTRRTDLVHQAQWIDHPVVQVRHYDFDITLRDDARPLQVTTRMAVYNPHPQPLDTLVFGLNGALAVDLVRRTGGDGLRVRQAHQLLVVDLQDHPLLPGAVDTLTLSYAGNIDAAGFMIDRLPDDKGLIQKSGDGPWIKGNMSAWLDADLAVLPAQCGWYPIPGAVGGYPFDRPRPADFATAEIRIHTLRDVQVVTQGIRHETVISENQWHTTFEVSTPVPAFSLNIGPYTRLARRFARTEVELLFFKEHLVNYDVFSDVADTCYQVVDRLFELYKEVTGTPYPYPRLSFVEVPLQMQVYTTTQGVDNVLLQPGVIMIDEVKLAGRRFEKAIDRAKQDARRNGRDDTAWRLKRDVFIRTVLGVLIPDQDYIDGSLYTPIRNYYHFRMDLAHPVLSRALELQFHEAIERLTHDTFFPDRWNATLSSNDHMRFNDSERAIRRRYGTEIDSVLNVLRQTPLMAMRPRGDGAQYRAAIDFKAPPVLNMLQDLVGEEAYGSALEYLRTNRLYGRVTLEDFLDVVQAYSVIDITPFSDQWFRKATFPGYRIIRADVEKWDTGKMRIAYQVKVRVRNGEEGDGFVRVVVSTRHDRIRRPMALNSYEEKEMHIVTADVPENVQVVPFFSRNRGRIMKPVTMERRLRRGTPSDTIFTVKSSRDSLDFVVDDQDEGFFIPQTAEARYLRPPMTQHSWRQLNQTEAYGRYIFGFRYKWAAGGEFPVRWETGVPRTGYYDLSLHMPNRDHMRRRYELTIQAADGMHKVTIRPHGKNRVWWPLGRFRFSREEPATVELSDKGEGYILADAIRWTYIE